MNKKIIAITLILDSILLAIFCKRIETFGVTNLDLSWTASSILPKASIVIFSIMGSLLLFQSVKKKWIWTIPIICFGIAFTSSPIYQGDYNKLGSDEMASLDTNSFILSIEKQDPKLTGLIALVSPSCSHCVDAAERLTLLQTRSPNLNVSYLIFAYDSLKAKYFKKITNPKKSTYYSSTDTDVIYPINYGSFPYFLYFKNGKVIHRWRNEQMGYRALDWIENGL